MKRLLLAPLLFLLVSCSSNLTVIEEQLIEEQKHILNYVITLNCQAILEIMYIAIK